MNERVNPFANLAKPPEFAPKPRRDKPVANDAIDRIAEEHNFPRRQPRKAAGLRCPNGACIARDATGISA